ncbi:hypothetical protein ACWDTT_33225 [Streptosporangium sandarakinum]
MDIFESSNITDPRLRLSADDAKRLRNDPDWAPEGGTSTRRWKEISASRHTTFVGHLRTLTDIEDHLPGRWRIVPNTSATIYLLPDDDVHGGEYFINYSTTHYPGLPGAQQPVHLQCLYRRENQRDIFRAPLEVRFTDTDYTGDTALHAAVLLGAVRLHCQQVAAGNPPLRES